MIAHSYSEGGGLGTSSGKVSMAPKFKTLGQKKSKAVADPPMVLDPPIIQDLQLAPSPILASTTISEVDINLLEAPLLDKHKGKHLVRGSSKKHKKKKGEMSLAFFSSSIAQDELWKPEFSVTELGK